jgi:hypothetical protein
VLINTKRSSFASAETAILAEQGENYEENQETTDEYTVLNSTRNEHVHTPVELKVRVQD